jgi:hypothetical protein
MALNPFFLQGTANEQFLVQDLINEQLKIYGVDVYYLPRKIVDQTDILKEISMSKFDDNFIIEAYVNNFEGYGRNSDILTKFGLKSTNEVSLTLSKERFDNFIGEFLETGSDSEYIIDGRPREGDLIFFPLGERLFEIKHVEFENPFYQLGKNYIYELSCELFEYEDEIMDTSIESIQTAMDDVGYITRIVVNGIGQTAGAAAEADAVTTGQVIQILVTNDGTGYTEAPTIQIAAPETGSRATAVGVITEIGGQNALGEILIQNTGFGYTQAPAVLITGGGPNATGAAATTILGDTAIRTVGVGTSVGSGYITIPDVTVGDPNTAYAGFTTAQLVAIKNPLTTGIGSVFMRHAGIGYTSAPTVTFALPNILVGVGTTIAFGSQSGAYEVDELITGSISGNTARVRSHDIDTDVVRVVVNSGGFTPGEILTGSSSTARYAVQSYSDDNVESTGTGADFFDNDTFESEADAILDFTESNPFGEY